MPETHPLDQVTADFAKLAQQHSVGKWDAPYGGKENPLLFERAEGDHVFTPDNKPHIDWNNGILSVIFGYGDPEIVQALSDQIKTNVWHTSSDGVVADGVKKLNKAIALVA